MTRRMFSPSPKAHHLVMKLHMQMIAEQMTLLELSERSGVSYHTMKLWWSGDRSPKIVNLEAAFEVFGMSLKVTRMPEKSKANGSEHTRRPHA